MPTKPKPKRRVKPKGMLKAKKQLDEDMTRVKKEGTSSLKKKKSKKK